MFLTHEGKISHYPFDTQPSLLLVAVWGQIKKKREESIQFTQGQRFLANPTLSLGMHTCILIFYKLLPNKENLACPQCIFVFPPLPFPSHLSFFFSEADFLWTKTLLRSFFFLWTKAVLKFLGIQSLKLWS